jgi:hypothetical protein
VTGRVIEDLYVKVFGVDVELATLVTGGGE